MEPAPDLRTLMFEIYRLLTGSSELVGFALDDPNVHGTGSDPGEWWDGGVELEAILGAQGAALAGSAILGEDPQAWSNGDTGWVYDRFVYRTPDGVETPFRVTATFVRRDGAWRLVLWHDSVPIRNEDAIGVRIPT